MSHPVGKVVEPVNVRLGRQQNTLGTRQRFGLFVETVKLLHRWRFTVAQHLHIERVDGRVLRADFEILLEHLQAIRMAIDPARHLEPGEDPIRKALILRPMRQIFGVRNAFQIIKTTPRKNRVQILKALHDFSRPYELSPGIFSTPPNPISIFIAALSL